MIDFLIALLIFVWLVAGLGTFILCAKVMYFNPPLFVCFIVWPFCLLLGLCQIVEDYIEAEIRRRRRR